MIYQDSRQNRRAENQDALFSLETDTYALMAIFDGMGGHQNGKQAAEAALEALKSYDLTNLDWNALFDHLEARVQPTKGGSTASVVLFDKQTNECKFAWCGDSPILIIRDYKTLWKARAHNTWGGLEAYLGLKESRYNNMGVHRPELHTLPLAPKDIILVASDGLDPALFPPFEEPTEDLCEYLIEKAIQAGSTDNCTIMVMQV